LAAQVYSFHGTLLSEYNLHEEAAEQFNYAVVKDPKNKTFWMKLGW
jgi:hypothetical protein